MILTLPIQTQECFREAKLPTPEEKSIGLIIPHASEYPVYLLRILLQFLLLAILCDKLLVGKIWLLV